MATPQLKVTFLGLGGMGSAIAKSIQEKGFELVVWSRTASKADDFVKAGARVAATPREAVADADIIVSCLFDDKSCLDTAQGENGYLSGIRKGAVHVNTTTITPDAATRLEKLHDEHGAHYVSGTILGRPETVAAGKLRSFLGGKREAIERARSVVESYSGGPILVVDENPAHANVLKLTANMILAANISLFGQVYALNERWGIDHNITDQLLGIFCSHPGLVAYAEHVRDRDYVKAPGEGFGVEGGLKDVNAMLATGEEVGVPLPFCGVMREQFISTIGHGMKDMEWSALGDAARLSAGVSPPTQEKK